MVPALGDDADLRDVADAAAHLARLADQVVTGDGRGAGARHQQGREHAQGRGLAGAVRAEQPDDLALGDIEIDAADRVNRTGLRLEAAGQAASVDHGGSSLLNESRRDHRH